MLLCVIYHPFATQTNGTYDLLIPKGRYSICAGLMKGYDALPPVSIILTDPTFLASHTHMCTFVPVVLSVAEDGSKWVTK